MWSWEPFDVGVTPRMYFSWLRPMMMADPCVNLTTEEGRRREGGAGRGGAASAPLRQRGGKAADVRVGGGGGGAGAHPRITEWLRKLVRKPNRITPMTASMMPTSRQIWTAATL